VAKSAETSHEGKVTVLWNEQVRTDRIIPNNKLDITIRDNNQETWMFIDVANPRNRNVMKK
jgi:3-isopropylmalate dehydratase small subunit